MGPLIDDLLFLILLPILLPFYFSRNVLGYCSSCGNWLGSRSESLIEQQVSPAGDDLNKQMWIVSRVGELLASAPDLSVKLPKHCIAAAIQCCLNRYARGNLSALARLFGVTVQGLWDLLYRGSVPYFESLLQICQILSISPLEFINLNAAQSLSIQNSTLDPLLQVVRSRKKRQHLTTEYIQCIKLYLEAILRPYPKTMW